MGRLILKIVPLEFDVKSISPPHSSTYLRALYRPRPFPSSFVVNPFLNSFSFKSSDIPVPLSWTSIILWFFVEITFISILPVGCLKLSTELFIKLEMIHFRFPLCISENKPKQSSVSLISMSIPGNLLNSILFSVTILLARPRSSSAFAVFWLSFIILWDFKRLNAISSIRLIDNCTLLRDSSGMLLRSSLRPLRTSSGDRMSWATCVASSPIPAAF